MTAWSWPSDKRCKDCAYFIPGGEGDHRFDGACCLNPQRVNKFLDSYCSHFTPPEIVLLKLMAGQGAE